MRTYVTIALFLEAWSASSLLAISLNPKWYRISWVGKVITNELSRVLSPREIRYVSPGLEGYFVY